MLVRTSQRLAFQSRSSDGSYRPSMRRNGLPDRRDVGCRVVVAIMVRAALRALPFLDAQHDGAVDVTARRAHLAARKPAVDFDDRAPGALGLGLQQAGNHPDAGIRHAASQAVVLNHASQVQILDVDRVELLDQIGRQLLRNILAGVRDFGVQLRNGMHRMLAPIAALGLARQPALQHRHALLVAVGVLRVRDALAAISHRLAQRRQSTQAEVDADCLAGRWQWDGRDLDDRRDEVAPAGVAQDADARRFEDFVARPYHLERADLGNRQRARVGLELETALGVLGRLRAKLALEARIGCALLEEVRVGCLQVAQRLLQRHARYLVEPGHIGLFFEQRQRRTGLRVPDALTVLEADTSQVQCPVPHIAHTAEGLRKLLGLVVRRVDAVGVASLHALQLTRKYCRMQASLDRSAVALYLPGLKPEVYREFW